jgi:transposase
MAGGRPLKVVWREDAAILGQQYLQEHDVQLRPRLHALWLLREGRRLADTAAVVGVHYRTVQDWLAWYRRGGLAEVRTHRRAGRGRAGWLSAEQRTQLVEQAARGGFFTAQDVQQWIADTFGVHYRRGSVYSLLQRLGCHPKVPRPYNPRSSTEEQEEWKKGGSPKRSPTRG